MGAVIYPAPIDFRHPRHNTGTPISSTDILDKSDTMTSTPMTATDLLRHGTCAVLREGRPIGTAWLVSREGHLLTAGHVVDSNRSDETVTIRFPEDIPRTA